jgi:hypothetical protein
MRHGLNGERVMSDVYELSRAREDLAAALDSKLKDIPEWRAIRAIDRALAALDSSPPKPTPARVVMPDGSVKRIHVTYTGLARRLIQSNGSPATTPEIIEFIGRNRKLDPNAEKAKINITTSLSKDPQFASIPWAGGRAWWLPELGDPKPSDGTLKFESSS